MPQGKIFLKGPVCCSGEEFCRASRYTDLCLLIDVPSPGLVLLYTCLWPAAAAVWSQSIHTGSLMESWIWWYWTMVIEAVAERNPDHTEWGTSRWAGKYRKYMERDRTVVFPTSGRVTHKSIYCFLNLLLWITCSSFNACLSREAIGYCVYWAHVLGKKSVPSPN